MSFETDLLIDRRRLVRRLVAWRAVAILGVLAAVLVAIGRAGWLPQGPHIERLTVSGLITEDRARTEAVEKLARDPMVAALIVSVDSPGGTVAGGESLHDAIAQVAAVKPVVTVMRGVAASAAYMVSVPAARIFARGATLTGSIGVLLETGEISGLLDKLGIATDTIVSGPLKDQPSFFHPTSPQGQQVLQGLVTDLYEQFVAMVATGRHMSVEQVKKLADGRAYTGRQALALGLVDQLGGERAARDWLVRVRHVPRGLPVRDLKTGGWSVDGVRATLSGLLGFAVGPVLPASGAWALWRPGAN
ncbi:MAG TPA: signal peptide peptidase SppA [Acetobacteraceae bacterium]|nr:signal peptide peptidase SppA [Acetobacteraceae bacterium]